MLPNEDVPKQSLLIFKPLWRMLGGTRTEVPVEMDGEPALDRFLGLGAPSTQSALQFSHIRWREEDQNRLGQICLDLASTRNIDFKDH